MNAISLIGISLTPIFLVFFFMTLKFLYSKEGKTESGKKIILKSYKYAIMIFPVGWLLAEFSYRFIGNVSYQTYREYMMILILLLFIVQGISLTIAKKTMKNGDRIGV